MATVCLTNEHVLKSNAKNMPHMLDMSQLPTFTQETQKCDRCQCTITMLLNRKKQYPPSDFGDAHMEGGGKVKPTAYKMADTIIGTQLL